MEIQQGNFEDYLHPMPLDQRKQDDRTGIVSIIERSCKTLKCLTAAPICPLSPRPLELGTAQLLNHKTLLLTAIPLGIFFQDGEECPGSRPRGAGS